MTKIYKYYILFYYCWLSRGENIYIWSNAYLKIKDSRKQMRKISHIHLKSYDHGCINHLTYKVFNLHFLKQCGTNDSHLFLNNLFIPQVWIHSFLKRKLFHHIFRSSLRDTHTTSQTLQGTRHMTTTTLEKLSIQGDGPLLEPDYDTTHGSRAT